MRWMATALRRFGSRATTQLRSREHLSAHRSLTASSAALLLSIYTLSLALSRQVYRRYAAQALADE
jgi:hypothetical protein